MQTRHKQTEPRPTIRDLEAVTHRHAQRLDRLEYHLDLVLSRLESLMALVGILSERGIADGER